MAGSRTMSRSARRSDGSRSAILGWHVITQRLSGKLSCLALLVHKWWLLLLCLGGQPVQHPTDRADPNPRLAGTRMPLVILAVTPIPAEPREAPVRHPPLGHLHESLGLRRTLHHLDLKRLLPRLQPAIQRLVLVLPIAPDRLQTRIVPTIQLTQDRRRRRPIVDRGRRDHHRQEQPQRIKGDVPLPPADLLAPVVALLTTDLGGFDRLAVDVGDLGRRFAPRGHPDLGTQGIDDPLPGAVVAPLGEVVIDGALGLPIATEQKTTIFPGKPSRERR